MTGVAMEHREWVWSCRGSSRCISNRTIMLTTRVVASVFIKRSLCVYFHVRCKFARALH